MKEVCVLLLLVAGALAGKKNQRDQVDDSDLGDHHGQHDRHDHHDHHDQHDHHNQDDHHDQHDHHEHHDDHDHHDDYDHHHHHHHHDCRESYDCMYLCKQLCFASGAEKCVNGLCYCQVYPLVRSGKFDIKKAMETA